MNSKVWIKGPVQSGKTTALIEQFCQDAQRDLDGVSESSDPKDLRSTLVFAMNAENRTVLAEALVTATTGQVALRSTTPLGFFEDEVNLFWPLIMAQLPTEPHVPLRLRPETEQYLAKQFWGLACLERLNGIERFSWDRWVRNLLDSLQLMAFCGAPLEDFALRLDTIEASGEDRQWMADLLMSWRDWCLARGLVTYGIVSELFWRFLLPNPIYQRSLAQRFNRLYADDVENYPAIARDLFETLQAQDVWGTFTYNAGGSVRLGLGADPEYLSGLARDAQYIELSARLTALGEILQPNLESYWQRQLIHFPDSVQTIQTITRSQLLRKTAEAIVQLVQSGEVEASEIAVLGPGLDSLARYTLIDIIESHNIPVLSFKDQRSLNSSAIIRSLLTLMTLVYTGLGEKVDQELVTEMLGTLSAYGPSPTSEESPAPSIDPARAALLVDYCFKPDLVNPRLLPVQSFVRWDRLGAQAAIAYTRLHTWIEQEHQEIQGNLAGEVAHPVAFLNRAIQQFFAAALLRYDQLAVIREFIETAQHFWTVYDRLVNQNNPVHERSFQVSQFIQLLRQGTLTANPEPLPSLGIQPTGVVLATAYQYRIARLSHRYHFWLDIGSPLWQQGNLIALWRFPLFVRNPQSQSPKILIAQEEQQLKDQIMDLSLRVKEQLYLCHSDLSVAGQEQMGSLLSLVSAAES